MDLDRYFPPPTALNALKLQNDGIITMRFLSPSPSLIIWNKGEGTTLNWQPTRCPELDILTPCVLSPIPWNGHEHPILRDGVWAQRRGGTREWWSQSLKSCDLLHDANESVGQESQLPLPAEVLLLESARRCLYLPAGASRGGWAVTQKWDTCGLGAELGSLASTLQEQDLPWRYSSSPAWEEIK